MNMTVGQRVELVCQASGSRPPAKINWFMSDLVSKGQFIVLVDNNNNNKLVSTYEDNNLVGIVFIINEFDFILVYLQNAPVNWRKNEKLLEHYSESTSDDGAVTTNFLTFVPSKEDNDKLLACTAINEQFSNFRIEDTLHLDVHCNYDQALLPLLCLSYQLNTTKPSFCCFV